MAGILDLSTEAKVTEAIAKLDSDLAYLMDERRVTRLLQASLSVRGFTSLNLFSLLDDARAGVQDFARTELALDPTARPADRLGVACIIDAWEAAKERVVKKNVVAAESAASRLPKLIPRTELAEIKKKFISAWYKIEDDLTPSIGMVEEALFESMDDGELKPRPET